MDIDRIIVACYLGQIISRLFWVLEIVALIAVFYDIIWVLAITEKVLKNIFSISKRIMLKSTKTVAFSKFYLIMKRFLQKVLCNQTKCETQ